MYNELNQPEKAIQELQAILALQRSDYVLNELASTYLEKLNSPKEALKFALQASKINANNENVQFTLADTYYQLGDYRKSNSLYQEVAKKVAGNSSFYNKVAEAALKIGNNDRAAIYFEKALSTGQNFPERVSAEKQLQTLLYQ
nr:tetratricopeptide repeat protein [Bathymodiolus japonicus methanotrophic gill symbiont]